MQVECLKKRETQKSCFRVPHCFIFGGGQCDELVKNLCSVLQAFHIHGILEQVILKCIIPTRSICTVSLMSNVNVFIFTKLIFLR